MKLEQVCLIQHGAHGSVTLSGELGSLTIPLTPEERRSIMDFTQALVAQRINKSKPIRLESNIALADYSEI